MLLELFSVYVNRGAIRIQWFGGQGLLGVCLST